MTERSPEYYRQRTLQRRSTKTDKYAKLQEYTLKLQEAHIKFKADHLVYCKQVEEFIKDLLCNDRTSKEELSRYFTKRL